MPITNYEIEIVTFMINGDIKNSQTDNQVVFQLIS